MKTEPSVEASRFVVGIDLGTTNCSCAFVDTQAENWTVRDFLIPQIVAANTIEAREVLPSFHYEPAAAEFPPGALRLPWGPEDANHVVGAFARDHGAAVPGRLISSAKSWLSHRGVDRTAPLLPWHAASDVERLSPVDVSSRYLAHIRAAWDHAHPAHPLAAQDVVLTVPASFDEVARELTVEASRRAGLVKLTLVEEPQAAFYAWIHSQGDGWESQVAAGQRILVADVGGGTTDFTLIRANSAEGGKVMFQRIAVGEHLILGGDNLDLALAHHIETRVAGGAKLPPGQWGTLLRSARVVKETMLAQSPPDRVTVNIAAGGSKLVGGSRQIELERAEVHRLLIDGFLPRTTLADAPATRRSGFQEFGLPFAADPAITRYLAAFLAAHRDDTDGEAEGQAAARPDVLLFNGGFFASPQLRQRFIEVLSSWFSRAESAWRPIVLQNDRLDLAVSRGAAYYGMVRRGKGVRIRGGLAHSYYIGVETGASRQSAICLLPAGVEEGQDVPLERAFNLLIRQPVEFPLYYSATRTADPPGAMIDVDPEQLTGLPPIRTVLQSGRRSSADTVQVNLHARLTEIGTLELWAQELNGERQWRLQFDVRSASRTEIDRHHSLAEGQGIVDASILSPAASAIREAFASGALAPATSRSPSAPQSLVKQLEEITSLSRHEWPASLMRSFWEVLFDLSESRGRSTDHESRWLSLVGFSLRPGYGLAVDDWRVAQTWRLFAQKVRHPRNELCRAEWWILWRRIAGGLSPGQQLTLAEGLLPALKSRLRAAGALRQPATSPFQYGPHETAEVYRLLGSLELLKLHLKDELGDHLLDHFSREKTDSLRNASLFALGRLGSRVPAYGPLNLLLSPDVAERWAHRLMRILPSPQSMFALVQLARRTDDRHRDLTPETRDQVVTFLKKNGASPHYTRLVETGGQLEAEEQKLTFGESLPRGLRIE